MAKGMTQMEDLLFFDKTNSSYYDLLSKQPKESTFAILGQMFIGSPQCKYQIKIILALITTSTTSTISTASTASTISGNMIGYEFLND